jgi:hypothetical protein
MIDVLVVTSPDDARTRFVVEATCPSARLLVTDAFYRGGARFNKGAAMEEAFDAAGKDSWVMVIDADTLLPDEMPLDNLDPQFLYSAPRRILESGWPPPEDWGTLPLRPDRSYPGYLHLFHPGARCLGDRPWYDPTYTHAGGCDAYFERKFGAAKRKLPFEVLHLGPCDTNWMGRVSNRLDHEPIPESHRRRADMEKLRRAKGWGRPKGGTFEERIW